MVSGLSDLHRRGILHRDLKSSNVIVFNSKSARPFVKICDLGLSRLDMSYVGEEDPGYTFHVQTRWYRAPEVLLAMPYGKAADVWSLGCIIAELRKGVTGQADLGCMMGSSSKQSHVGYIGPEDQLSKVCAMLGEDHVRREIKGMS